jgi:protein TonB
MLGHAALLILLVWVTRAAAIEAADEDDVVPLIPVAQEEPPPPPPPPPPTVKVQDVPPVEVPKGFQTLTVPQIVLPDIPPPRVNATEISERDFTGMGVQGGRADGDSTLKTVTAENIEAAPAFTPMTIRPELKNEAEVARALERAYPPLLRDAGIGGTTIVWFFIDERGTVVKTQLNQTSGYDALDEAALKVANVMKFSPAKNRDQIVRVWVQIPIKFTAK